MSFLMQAFRLNNNRNTKKEIEMRVNCSFLQEVQHIHLFTYTLAVYILRCGIKMKQR